MSKTIHVLSLASTWPSGSGKRVGWGICPGAHHCPLVHLTDKCNVWKILPFLKSKHKFSHIREWTWGPLDWVSAKESTAKTVERLCLVC